ncbi:MAG: transposase zinc-binding domain-containing protein [Candidatus Methylomirabilota bacterium]
MPRPAIAICPPCPPAVPTPQNGVYRSRRPETSPLWQIVARHLAEFLIVYDDRYAPTHGPLRAVVPRALESFHRCGILAYGFARVRCPDCRHEYLLAFSCKQRCLCPSCHAKRQSAFGEFVTEEILEPVPHRHVVISLPRRLRPFFRRRKRLTRLARLAYETIKGLLQAATGTRAAVPGAVACLQSAGSLLDWHPHVHLLVS